MGGEEAEDMEGGGGNKRCEKRGKKWKEEGKGRDGRMKG
jgi:hypothetical protein